MKFQAITDFDVVALQTEDDLTCLLTLTAPVPDGLAERPGECLIAALDNSGSMAGAPIEAAKSALHALVDRMKPQDVLGVVTFSKDARIAVPARSVADHHLPSVHALIEAIDAETSTDLGAGFLLGLAEARRGRTSTGASLMLLSDGHANVGITDAARLGGLAAKGRSEGVTSITIGLGDGYDELLLHEIAARGQGSHRFAFTPDDAVAVVAEEAGDLLSKSIVNAFVRIRTSAPGLLDGIGTLHDVPRWIDSTPSGPVLTVPMGDLYAGETRELLVRFHVPGVDALGPYALGDIVVDYVSLPGLESKTITWPVTVNVASEELAGARLPNPIVTTAVLLANATEAKRAAAEALGNGETQRADRIFAEQAEVIAEAARAARQPPHADRPELADRLDEERAQLDKLAHAARERDAWQSRKSLIEDVSMNLRGRGDQQRRERARKRREF